MIKMNKKAMTQQVMIMIFMIILMAGIIIFGISKLNSVENTLSQQEHLEIQNKINSIAQYCENPLNKGSIAREEFSTENFNGICIINNKLPQELSSIPENQNQSLNDIIASGDNMILLNVEIIENNIPQSIQIVDSFSSYSTKTKCWFGEKKIEVEMMC